jgi:hypothetical protein
MTGRPTSLENPPKQWDLFGERGVERSDIAAKNVEVDPITLEDQDLIEQVAKAKLSNVHALCTQIIERNLGDTAVPALVALWSRFQGFGIITPLPEQQLALQTLGAIGNHAAQAAISKILVAPDLPDNLLPLALQTATTVALRLPQRQVIPWLGHEAPIVRALAFTLIQAANPPLNILETGLTDPDPSVRRAALVTVGNLGHHVAKSGLLAEFGKNPTSQIVRALLAIADEEIIVIIGRYALENQAHQALIADELSTLDDPKATKNALRIKTQMQQR